MAMLQVLYHPDPRLRIKAAAVAVVDDEVRRLAADMLETMYAAPGIGLAAPQVGVPKRAFVADLSGKDEPAPIYVINPEITARSATTNIAEEGCLSLPKHFGEVARFDQVRVRYLDREGATQEIDADGLLARCLQHEIDHLNGILFVDHLSALKRTMILRKLAKAKRHRASG
jgi:peptide deformylase